jgi:hypothetical protein
VAAVRVCSGRQHCEYQDDGDIDDGQDDGDIDDGQDDGITLR